MFEEHVVCAERPQLDLTTASTRNAEFPLLTDHPITADEIPTRSTPDPPRFRPLDYAPFDAPASPHVFSIATSFPSPTLEYVPRLSPSTNRCSADETSWPWNWDDAATNTVSSPGYTSQHSPQPSPSRGSPHSPPVFRKMWREKLASITEGEAVPTKQISPSRDTISLTSASIASRRATGAHASGPGHGALEGGKDDLFDDMIRLVETKRRYDRPFVNSSGQERSRTPLSSGSSEGSYPLSSTLTVVGHSRTYSPDMLPKDTTVLVPPISQLLLPSSLPPSTESNGIPKRPKLRTSNTWPSHGSRIDAFPSLPHEEDSVIFGDASLSSEAGSTSGSHLGQHARIESVTTASGGDCAVECSCSIGSVITSADADADVDAANMPPELSDNFGLGLKAFERMSVQDSIPMNRSSSSPASSKAAAAATFPKATPNRANPVQSSTSIASPLQPSKVNRLRRWREQSFGHFWDREPDQDAPLASTSTREQAPEIPKSEVAGRRSKEDARGAAKNHGRSRSGEMPLDMVGTFTWVVQSRPLSLRQKGEAEFREEHEHPLKLEHGHRRRASQPARTPKPSRNDWSVKAGSKLSGMDVLVRGLGNSNLLVVEPSEPPQVLHTPLGDTLDDSDNITVRASFHSVPTSTAVAVSTSGPYPGVESLPVAPAPRRRSSRPRNVFGGVAIFRSPHRKGAVPTDDVDQRRLKHRVSGEAC